VYNIDVPYTLCLCTIEIIFLYNFESLHLIFYATRYGGGAVSNLTFFGDPNVGSVGSVSGEHREHSFSLQEYAATTLAEEHAEAERNLSASGGSSGLSAYGSQSGKAHAAVSLNAGNHNASNAAAQGGAGSQSGADPRIFPANTADKKIAPAEGTVAGAGPGTVSSAAPGKFAGRSVTTNAGIIAGAETRETQNANANIVPGPPVQKTMNARKIGDTVDVGADGGSVAATFSFGDKVVQDADGGATLQQGSTLQQRSAQGYYNTSVNPNINPNIQQGQQVPASGQPAHFPSQPSNFPSQPSNPSQPNPARSMFSPSALITPAGHGISVADKKSLDNTDDADKKTNVSGLRKTNSSDKLSFREQGPYQGGVGPSGEVIMGPTNSGSMGPTNSTTQGPPMAQQGQTSRFQRSSSGTFKVGVQQPQITPRSDNEIVTPRSDNPNSSQIILVNKPLNNNNPNISTSRTSPNTSLRLSNSFDGISNAVLIPSLSGKLPTTSSDPQVIAGTAAAADIADNADSDEGLPLTSETTGNITAKTAAKASGGTSIFSKASATAKRSGRSPMAMLRSPKTKSGASKRKLKNKLCY
jgi:hypothetical protein